ncbi:MAG: insulinase family protein [Candidatus Eisenbacteria bacterium]|nr:insulinase family protein [Candidatus Eisenbacteria bacterium]
MLADLGADLEVSASADYISITVETPAGAHRNALEILADVAVAPTLPPEEREKVREDLRAQIAGLSDRPFDALNREFYDRLYRKSPYRKPLLGTEESITGIAESDLREFLARTVVGANVVVSVSGPVDPAAIESWAQGRFGRLPAGKAIAIDARVIDGAPKEAVEVTIERDSEQVVYNTGWPTVSVTDPDYIPLRTAVGVLGDRFFFKYVYEKGVAYRSWFYQTERLGAGSAQNEMGVSPSIYRQISTEVVEDLARFTAEPIPAEELSAAQRKLISRHYLGLQTNLALAQRLAFYELSGLGIEEIDRYPVEVREVTPEEAGAAARKYLPEGRSTRVAIGKASDHQP